MDADLSAPEQNAASTQSWASHHGGSVITKEDRYDPSQVSAHFMSTMTVAGLLTASNVNCDGGNDHHSGAANLTALDASNVSNAQKSTNYSASRRIANETKHEERLRIMMQKMCRDLKESHFPGTTAGTATHPLIRRPSAAVAPTTTTTTIVTYPYNGDHRGVTTYAIADVGASSSVSASSPPATADGGAASSSSQPQRQHYPFIGDPSVDTKAREENGELSKYPKERAAEKKAKEALEAEKWAEREARATGGPIKPDLLYPSYYSNELSTEWTETVLKEPHLYTEFLCRQQKTASELSALSSTPPSAVVARGATGAHNGSLLDLSTATTATVRNGVFVESDDAKRRKADANRHTGSKQELKERLLSVAEAKMKASEQEQKNTVAVFERHAIEDDDEAFTIKEAVVPAMAVVAKHLPKDKSNVYAETVAAAADDASSPLEVKEHVSAVGPSLVFSSSLTTDPPPPTSPHLYTAPLLVARQTLPPISPFTAVLGKHTLGRRFCPANGVLGNKDFLGREKFMTVDARGNAVPIDFRRLQYSAEEEERYERGKLNSTIPDGPIVAGWREPDAISITTLDFKRRGQLASPSKNTTQQRHLPPISLCDAMREELAALEAEDARLVAIAEAEKLKEKTEAEIKAQLRSEIADLQRTIVNSRGSVETAAMRVEAMAARSWEKETLAHQRELLMSRESISSKGGRHHRDNKDSTNTTSHGALPPASAATIVRESDIISVSVASLSQAVSRETASRNLKKRIDMKGSTDEAESTDVTRGPNHFIPAALLLSKDGFVDLGSTTTDTDGVRVTTDDDGGETVGCNAIVVEYLPLGSPLKAVRQLAVTSPSEKTREEARRREKEMILGALAVIDTSAAATEESAAADI